jgi:hypothetical protein
MPNKNSLDGAIFKPPLPFPETSNPTLACLRHAVSDA